MGFFLVNCRTTLFTNSGNVGQMRAGCCEMFGFQTELNRKHTVLADVPTHGRAVGDL